MLVKGATADNMLVISSEWRTRESMSLAKFHLQLKAHEKNTYNNFQHLVWSNIMSRKASWRDEGAHVIGVKTVSTVYYDTNY